MKAIDLIRWAMQMIERRYVSHDLDFVEEGPVPPRTVARVLAGLGFRRNGRHSMHPETDFLVEFPTGPLMVGEQRVKRFAVRDTPAGKLRLLLPTDCVKDRLAGFSMGMTGNRWSRRCWLPRRKR